MTVVLRRHVRPSKWTWKPSSKQCELWGVKKGASLDESSGTGVAGREQPQRWEANQKFLLVEGGPWAKRCCRLAEEQPEGVAMRSGALWRAVVDGAGRAGPSFPTVTCRCRSLGPPWVRGLREATGSLALYPQPLRHPLCLPCILGGHAQGGWPTASSSSCHRQPAAATTGREQALIEPLWSLPQSPGH